METAKKYMQRCLELAKKGLGNTAPNPMVGAVLVYKNKIIGEGFTSKYGGNHAEENCINSVKTKDKENVSKATLYVSLEPCSHFGKTPPCSNLIVEHKIPKVVIGTLDTNKLVSGKGVKHLKENGIEVKIGVLQKECINSNKRFFTFHNKKRPYIILKWAQTQDGFIAPKNNTSITWISNAFSKQLVHKLRAEEQAILVGTRTVIIDNPQLNCRSWKGKNPIRVVLDRRLRIPENHHVFDGSVKTIIITEKPQNKCPLKDSRALFFETVDYTHNLPQQICEVLYKHEIQSVIIEGGTQTLQSFIDANIWDEAQVFTGASSFKEGVNAPVLKGKIITESNIKNDSLKIYKKE